MKRIGITALMMLSAIIIVGCTKDNGGGNSYNSHEYVDLGLPSGTLWATCNVGATTPEGFGDYFAWGETTPKDTYDLSNYAHCIAIDNYNCKYTKYCTNSSYGYNGFTDNLTTLLPEDDAATANWGNGWCTPTDEQWMELKNYTVSVWAPQNGVLGRLFSASNGNSLFLPAAGYRWADELNYAGSIGYYWSSALRTDDPRDAWSVGFNSDDYRVCSYYRYTGFTVRPVRSARQN